MVRTLVVESEGQQTRNAQGLSNTGKASQTTVNKPWDLCIQLGGTEFFHHLNDQQIVSVTFQKGT